MSAWGKAFGKSFGAAFGSVGAAPPVVESSFPSGGGGGYLAPASNDRADRIRQQNDLILRVAMLAVTNGMLE